MAKVSKTHRGNRLRFSVRKIIEYLLKGSYDHFPMFLPARKGLLATWFLKLFYAGISDNPNQTAVIKNLPPEAIVVYVSKHKSYFEFLFYHQRYRQLRLPFPEIGFDYNVFVWQPLSRMLRFLLSHLDALVTKFAWPNPYRSDYICRQLLDNHAAFLSLVGKKAFYRRFIKAQTDPVQYLIEIQKTIERPIYLVPQLMFFGKKPYRVYHTLWESLLGPEFRPGKLRRLLTLFKNPGRIFIEVSEPIDLKRFIAENAAAHPNTEHQALLLRRNLLLQINRHRQSITGPVLKSREEIRESILTSERLKTYLDQHARKRELPLWKVRKEADGYIEEIAARYNPAFVAFAARVVAWIIETIFQGVSINAEGLNRVKAMAQKGPLIFVPCHKSHIDYLMLPYLLYTNNMPGPHIAAGKNLSFWPLGPIFRAGGAFFLRRTFKGNVLYAKVFAAYVHKLLEEGFNIKIFIEGTRSRTGKLIMPKLGFLSILLEALKNGACQDLLFAPIYIGYDRVLEENAYLHEIEGGQKEPENLKQVLRAGKFLKNRYGRIYVKFHEPISLNQLLEERYATTLQQMPSKEQNALCRDLGWRIINAIDNVTVVTPHALVASAALNSTRRKFTFQELMAGVEIYMALLTAQRADLADTLQIDHVHAVQTVFDAYLQRKLIEPVSKDTEAPLRKHRVNVDRRMLLEYYKNNCVAYFIPAAFTAAAILARDAFQFAASDLHATYTALRSFFKYEFAYNLDFAPEYFVRKNIKTFIDEAILVPHQTLPDTYNLTSAGLRKLKFIARFLRTYFEAYWIVLTFFGLYPQNEYGPKERLKKIQSRGERMYKRHEVELIESLSKIYYNNAINFFISHGVRGSEDREKIEHFEAFIQGYLKLLSV